ncbi:hypothetical protein AB0B13_19125 [Streptomyces sp. NPDC042898]|uniref:hypothetical protein n=1 Tax=Streptomyces sp. NPDC042898 TaxID=3154334 RepID=UPI0033DD11F2
MFEDHPDILELSNHVHESHLYHRDPRVRPGGRMDLKVEFEARSVVRRLDGARVFYACHKVGRSPHPQPGHLVVLLRSVRLRGGW